jgi:acyl-CoA synthetase (AMP-forming)/AMP-acid ligase II
MGEAGLHDLVTAPDRARAYRRAGQWDDVTLAGRVAALADSRPDDVAVVDDAGRGRHTYAELRRDSTTLAAALAGLGVRPRDVVSVQLPNWYHAVVAALAVQQAGAVINPLLPNYRVRELAHVFETAAPRAILTPATYRGFDHRPLIGEVTRATGHSVVHLVAGSGANRSDLTVEGILAGGLPAGSTWHPPTVVAADVSELIFTSGTEANPKAIMHTEQTTNFSARIAFAHLGMGPDDVVWMPSPIGHSTGFNYGVRFALYHGLALVLQDQWDPVLALELIERERCSYTLAATTFLQDLVGAAGANPARRHRFRHFGCGGAPVPPDLVEAAAGLGITVRRLYGSTEMLVATWNGPSATLAQRMQTDGSAVPHVEVTVRDDDGRPSPEGAPGEIWGRGPNTCVGFFRDPERTARTFLHDGWVRSGDLATIDAHGYLTVVGRKKEIIIRGGINIAPREIEDLLHQFPEVERAAVVGLPDPRLGERSCACLVLRAGATLDLETTVARLRAGGLATYKLPERLVVLDTLPTTASGKVQKHEIVRRLAGSGTAGAAPYAGPPASELGPR